MGPLLLKPPPVLLFLAATDTVGQGTADRVVEEDEHQGDADTFIGQRVGLTLAVWLE
jgi:hypothetical protein